MKNLLFYCCFDLISPLSIFSFESFSELRFENIINLAFFSYIFLVRHRAMILCKGYWNHSQPLLLNFWIVIQDFRLQFSFKFWERSFSMKTVNWLEKVLFQKCFWMSYFFICQSEQLLFEIILSVSYASALVLSYSCYQMQLIIKKQLVH